MWYAQIDKVHARGWTKKEDGVEFDGNSKPKITKQRFAYNLYTHKDEEEEEENDDNQSERMRNSCIVHTRTKQTGIIWFNSIQFKFKDL